MTGNRSGREGATVFMQGDKSSVVKWVMNCKGEGREEARTEAPMRMLDALEAHERWCVQAEHLKGIDYALTDELPR